ncbi:DEAD/DEAH box helicase, partial [Candidatus Woesearchaeota archaeon]|nr:DEAD/DEAH box helicase [Candidatus Woesearchaeota archaeon]
ALQVSKDFETLSDKKLRVLAIYGGAPINKQIRALKQGIDIAVGTPGRIMDLMERGDLKISEVEFVVLDEADEMLDMGFVDDIKKILRHTGPNKRMLLFSATMPKEVLEIAKQFMREHKIIKTEELMVRLIDHIRYDVHAKDRYEALQRIISINPDFYGLIFCQTKSEVDSLTRSLTDDKYRAAALHGDFSQGQRENILVHFKIKKTNILVATDVAARGIDIDDITHVINYSIPHNPEVYLHRVGRTGRAGKKGVAITFVMPAERRNLRFVERFIGQALQKKGVPSKDEVLKTKKSQIKSIIEKLLEKKTTEFDSIVQELVANNPPEKVIAAALKYAFQEEMERMGRKDISPVIEQRKEHSHGKKHADHDKFKKRFQKSEFRRPERKHFGRDGRKPFDRNEHGKPDRHHDRSDRKSFDRNERRPFARHDRHSDRPVTERHQRHEYGDNPNHGGPREGNSRKFRERIERPGKKKFFKRK